MIPTKYLAPVIVSFGLFAQALHGQTSPSTPAPAAEDEGTVLLSPFLVSTEAAGRYQATDATSGTRMRIPLMDSSQSVSVITRDLVNDIGAGRLIDAAKYVSGISESTIPNAQDRTTIRGFQNDGATIDGFSYFSFANLDPVLIERVEVVKGPNAIIAPQGVPGGTVNNVSKRPLFTNQGYVSGQVGRYSSTRGELDVNRVSTDGKLAVRVVGAAQEADDYGDGNFHRCYIVMPMFTYKFGAQTQLTVQTEFYDWKALNFGGLPLSLYVGSNDEARLLDGLRRDYIVQHDDITRAQTAMHVRTFFTTNFTNNFSMRVAANFINSNAKSVQMNIGAATTQVVKINPGTGLWAWDGVTRNDTPLFPLGGSVNTQHRNYADFQNDYVYELKNSVVKSTTVAGWAVNYAVTYHELNQNFTVPSPVTLPQTTYTQFTLTNVTGENTRYNRNLQFYISESLAFFNNRMIVSAGVSRNRYYSDNLDLLTGNRVAATPAVTLPSAGLVVKIVDGVSLFYGYSKQATAVNPNAVIGATNYFDTQTSQQHEVGIRTQQLNNRLYATLSYFDIKQNNFSIPNPANSAVPVPSPLLPPLFSDRLAHGVELELKYAVTKDFSLVGSASSMKNRDADGVPFRGTAEKSAALWANYVFEKTSAVDGLSLGMGVDYLSERAGDTASGVTTSSTPTNVIRVQPSFWLPARTLVNANVAYRFDAHWRTQLNIENLLNTDYLQSSTGRTNVWPGAPINVRCTVTYSF